MTISNLPTGTVTFLFTDIEGSTKLALEHQDSWEALHTRHNSILRDAIESNHGYVFQIIGDSFCASFSTAIDGLRAAIQSQHELQNESWGNVPVKVRMGIHTGKAEIQEDGEYRGYLSLSRVQRVMSAGHGGQILVSQATQELIRDELPETVSILDLGQHRLKDLVNPEHIFQVNIPGLAEVFPALKTLDLQLNNLPIQLTHFVGRDREMAAIARLVQNPEVRLVTLTGAGGTGKTRLSLQVAADLLDEYEHGVWFVELASISNPELFLPTVASSLKVKEAAGKSITDVLNEYLSDKQLLLVLDNFEQIVGAAPQISELLNAAPKVKVLVSSREVLRLRGEHDYPVPPLGLPESKRKQTAAVLAQYEAIALFTQHAQAVNLSFELNEDNANVIAEICMKLDGLPLAIELAAAHSRLFKPAAMLEKLKNKLDTLTGGARDLPRRQQTIRGAIDWSYDLLNDGEKKLFARLGIFTGGWTLESAEAVCGSGLDTMYGIESLLEKSLIRQFEGVSGETRFTMLETIREYAFEKLSQGGELEFIQQAHMKYMDMLLDKVVDASSGPEEATWFTKLDDELENLRSIVDRALSRNQPHFVLKIGSLSEYWNQRGNFREAFGWLEHALTMDINDSLLEQAIAMKTAGNLVKELGEIQRAREYYESALALFHEIDDQDGIARCLNNLGNIAWADKDFEKARQLYKQSLAGQRQDSFITALTLNNLGSLARIRGDWQESRDYYLRSLEICERLGAEAGVSYANGFLGTLALVQRDLEKAKMHFENMMKANWVQVNPGLQTYINGILGYIHLMLGDGKNVQQMLDDSFASALEYLNQNAISKLSDSYFLFEGKARLELINGRVDRAAQLFGIAWTLRKQDDYPLTDFERPEYEARIAEVRAGIGDDAFETAFQKGRSMSLKDALQFAVE